MPIYTKVNGAVKNATACKVKVGGEWKKGIEVLHKENGAWKRDWRSSIVHTVLPFAIIYIPVEGATMKSTVVLTNVTYRLLDIKGDTLAEMHYDELRIDDDAVYLDMKYPSPDKTGVSLIIRISPDSSLHITYANYDLSSDAKGYEFEYEKLEVI